MAAPAVRRMRRVHKQPATTMGVRSEINVTPLVDVCLVLLIIFMVVGPMLARGKEVKVPETRHHVEEKDKNQAIIAIDDKGRIYYDKEYVTEVAPRQDVQNAYTVKDPDKLRAKITDHWDRAERQQAEAAAAGTADLEPFSRNVFVKGHKDLTYNKVYPVLVVVNEIGIPGIDLGTHEIKEAKE